ncbi:hypothetical protein [Caulobacter sp.]|uniref:hypothetical protein n=1 Tax=Caulobacter sp. TaxID=78 RepID=UPI003BB1B15E
MRPPFSYVKWPHGRRVIGPRSIPYLDAAGDRHDASVRIRIGARQYWAHDDGDVVDNLLGRAWAEIDGWRWAHTFVASDDIHLLRNCMWLTGVWMIRTAHDHGLTLLPDSATPVTEWTQLYAAGI